MSFPCPHCGEELADNAKACRACGSDAETGWSEDIDHHSVEIPEFLHPDDAGGWDRPKRARGFRIALVLILVASLIVPLGYYVSKELAAVLFIGLALLGTRVVK